MKNRMQCLKLCQDKFYFAFTTSASVFKKILPFHFFPELLASIQVIEISLKCKSSFEREKSFAGKGRRRRRWRQLWLKTTFEKAAILCPDFERTFRFNVSEQIRIDFDSSVTQVVDVDVFLATARRSTTRRIIFNHSGFFVVWRDFLAQSRLMFRFLWRRFVSTQH